MKETIKKIDPNKDYNLSEIVKNELMGKNKSYFICKNIINDDKWLSAKQQVLKAERRGTSVGTTYFVKGQNLINYLTKANSAKKKIA